MNRYRVGYTIEDEPGEYVMLVQALNKTEARKKAKINLDVGEDIIYIEEIESSISKRKMKKMLR